MDLKRLRIGTKVKAVNPGGCVNAGDIGILCRSFTFHDNEQPDNVTDTSGYYWLHVKGKDHEANCFTQYTADFKVLKY